MKRGRPKNPENVKPNEQPKPLDGLPTPPSNLNDVAKEVFVRLAKVLHQMNILTIGDSDLVASYAQWYAVAEAHSPDICPTTHVTGNGYPVLTPDYVIWRDAQKSMQKLLSDMGLTPASRTRVAAIVKEEVDEFTEFLKRRNGVKED